jgi:hemophore-related protein
LDAAYGQPPPQAASNLRTYFTAHPQEYYDLRGILAIYAVCVWSATSRTFAEKFHWLGEPFADAALRAGIINAVA